MNLLSAIQNFSPLGAAPTTSICALSTGLAMGMIWAGKKIAMSIEEEGAKKTAAKVFGVFVMSMGLLAGVISSAALGVFAAGGLSPLGPIGPVAGVIGGATLGIIGLVSVGMFFIKSLKTVNQERANDWASPHLHYLNNFTSSNLQPTATPVDVIPDPLRSIM